MTMPTYITWLSQFAMMLYFQTISGLQLEINQVVINNYNMTLVCRASTSIGFPITIEDPAGLLVTCSPSGFVQAFCDTSGYSIDETAKTVTLMRLAQTSDGGTWTCSYTSNPPVITDKNVTVETLVPINGNPLHINTTVDDGETITSATNDVFNAIYGCYSSAVKFEWKLAADSWQIVPQVSTVYTCATPGTSAYVSTQLTSEIWSHFSSGTKQTLSVTVLTMDNYELSVSTFSVYFSKGVTTSTTSEYSPIKESPQTTVFVQSNADISTINTEFLTPIDSSQLNTLNYTVFRTNIGKVASSITISAIEHIRSLFGTQQFETTIDTAAWSTDVSFFVNGSSLQLNSRSSMDLFMDSYKTGNNSLMVNTETTSSVAESVTSGNISTLSILNTESLFTKLTIRILTSELYRPTSEISSTIFPSFESLLSVSCSPKTYLDGIFTETVGEDLTSSEMEKGNKTAPINDTESNSSDVISSLETTPFHSILTSKTESQSLYLIETILSSMDLSYFSTLSSETMRFTLSFTSIESSVPTIAQTADQFENRSMSSTNRKASNTLKPSYSEITKLLTSEEESVTGSNLELTQHGLSETLDYSSRQIVDTVKNISDFEMSQHVASVTQSAVQISVSSSFSENTLIHTSLLRENIATSLPTETLGTLTTSSYSSINKDLTDATITRSDVNKISSTEHFPTVKTSIVVQDSFTNELKDPSIITASFVTFSSHTISSSSFKFQTELLSVEVTTTQTTNSLSESSKDTIFISTISGVIGIMFLLFIIALSVNGYFIKLHKHKNNKQKGGTPNYPGCSDTGGINNNSKSCTTDYPFSDGSIPLYFNNSASSFFPYADYYKNNWSENT